MMTAVSGLLPRLDRATRLFWRVTGRSVDLDNADAWLTAPMQVGSSVGDRWLAVAATESGGTLRDDVDHAGLLPDMSVLDGPGFAAADLHPQVRAFYEHTADWRMEVWTQWNPVFQPGGELISRMFGRRVQQLALPTRAMDVARGMDSRVEIIAGPAGEQVAAGWLRTLRSTGEYVYSGCYSSRRLPGADRSSVHVAFPLESGNAQVFLRPSVLPGGGLRLSSPAGRFGADGAYVVVREGGTYAARIPIHEDFRVYLDEESTLRTDHLLRLSSAPVLRLHYKLTPGR